MPYCFKTCAAKFYVLFFNCILFYRFIWRKSKSFVFYCFGARLFLLSSFSLEFIFIFFFGQWTCIFLDLFHDHIPHCTRNRRIAKMVSSFSTVPQDSAFGIFFSLLLTLLWQRLDHFSRIFGRRWVEGDCVRPCVCVGGARKRVAHLAICLQLNLNDLNCSYFSETTWP